MPQQKKTQRQLTQQDKKELIKARLLISPEMSNRAIGRDIGCSHVTVGKVRHKLEISGQIDHVDTSESKWLKHPLLTQNPALLDGLNNRGLRAIKSPGVLDKMLEFGLTSPVYAQRLINKERKAAGRLASGMTISEDNIIIREGNLLTGLPWIPDASVDLILTDPPYSREFLPLYKSLSILAGRVLKNGGSLLCMTGQSALPDVLSALCEDERLKYHWTLACVMNRSAANLSWMHVSAHFKPIIHMTKGCAYNGNLYSDLIMAKPPGKTREIPWQQPQDVFDELANRFVQHANTVILDPCCGSGTSLIAGIRTSCCSKIYGVDIDPHSVKITKRRVSELLYGSNESD